MKKTIIVTLVVIILAGCSSPGAAPTQTQIPSETPIPTERPKPTNTFTPEPSATFMPEPTRIPLSEIDIDFIFEDDSILPTGFSPGQIRHTAPQMFRNIPKAENTAYMQFERDGDTAGGVTIFLYDDPEKAEDVFQKIYREMGTDFTDSDYKKNYKYAIFESGGYGPLIEVTEGLLEICESAVIHVRITDKRDGDGVAAYFSEYIIPSLENLICEDE